MSRRRTALHALPLLIGAFVAMPSPAQAAGEVSIEVLSGRADLVTGGDAYVRVVVPGDAAGLTVTAGGRDVTSAFHRRSAGVDGIVTGLTTGANVVTATLPDGRGARITLTDHSLGGPVFSGPQIQPWTCAGAVKDAQCTRDPSYAYSYLSTAGGGFQAYDPKNPAADVAMTTTDQGTTVPFIVRTETGNSVRDQYLIAVLDDPSKPWDPTAPQPGYNSKLVLTHGASCDTAYEMGTAPDVMLQDALGRGFAVASHALDNAGHNCNLVTEAESLVVTKELVAKRYGPIRWTIGTGCSGGSLVQQQVANAYPGIYQGILPQCSFTDAWSSSQQYVDYTLLRRYLEGAGAAASGITPAQYREVYGHPNPANQVTFTEAIPNSGDPSRSCPGVPAADVFTTTSQKGVRCTLQDYMVNVFGRSADGKARRPYDNVGIQYGLAGLKDGTLLPSQFVALNTGIGGYDIDLEPQAARTEADPIALQRVFRSGAVNTAAHLDTVPIIDLRGPDPGAFHDVYRTSSMTERLKREHGTSANQALWEGPVPLIGSTAFVDQGIRAMDRWIAAIQADTRAVPAAQKVLDARKAAGILDRCATADGTDRPGMTSCPEVDATIFASPRIEAGAPVADDTMKCQLVPLDSFDYGSAAFTPDQKASLAKAFPTGVCDYSKPSVAKSDAVTWLAYDVVGGRPLGAAPVSQAFQAAAAPAAAASPTPTAAASPTPVTGATGARQIDPGDGSNGRAFVGDAASRGDVTAASGSGAVATSSGSLPRTGASILVGVAALALVGTALVLRRRG